MVITKRISLLIKQFHINKIMLECEQTNILVIPKVKCVSEVGGPTSISLSILIESHLVGVDINNILYSTLHILLVAQLTFLLKNIFIVNGVDTVYL